MHRLRVPPEAAAEEWPCAHTIHCVVLGDAQGAESSQGVREESTFAIPN